MRREAHCPDPNLGCARFSFSLVFGLPDEGCRAQIIGRYAKQLAQDEAAKLAAETGGFSGRDMRDICEQVRGARG